MTTPCLSLRTLARDLFIRDNNAAPKLRELMRWSRHLPSLSAASRSSDFLLDHVSGPAEPQLVLANASEHSERSRSSHQPVR